MAPSAPFVNIKRTSTSQIDSTPQLVFGSQNSCFIDSIWLCNTVDKIINTTLFTLDERDNVVTNHTFTNFYLLEPYESKEVLRGSILNMQAGDLVYANSTYSSDTFECHVSYREFNELSGN